MVEYSLIIRSWKFCNTSFLFWFRFKGLFPHFGAILDSRNEKGLDINEDSNGSYTLDNDTGSMERDPYLGRNR